MQETQVQPVGREDPLREEMATRSQILAWEIPWTEAPEELQTMGVQRVRSDFVTGCTHTHKQKTAWLSSETLRQGDAQDDREGSEEVSGSCLSSISVLGFVLSAS